MKGRGQVVFEDGGSARGTVWAVAKGLVKWGVRDGLRATRQWFYDCQKNVLMAVG